MRWGESECLLGGARGAVSRMADLEGAFRGTPQGALHQDGCACGGQGFEATHPSCHLGAHKNLHALKPLLRGQVGYSCPKIIPTLQTPAHRLQSQH